VPTSLRPGDAAEKTVPLTPEEIVRWASLSGDPNPLHHDEAAARRSRFGGLIACGGHLTALMTSFCAAFTTARGPALGLEFSYRLRKAARAGTTLRLRWMVERVEPSEKLRGDLIHLEGDVRDDSGAILVTARSTVLARDPL
jgi:acyl dehydratase